MDDVTKNIKHKRYCKKIIIFYHLQILSLASTFYKNETIAEQRFA